MDLDKTTERYYTAKQLGSENTSDWNENADTWRLDSLSHLLQIPFRNSSK